MYSFVLSFTYTNILSSVLYRLRQAKRCLQTCAKCTDSDHPGLCSPFVHSVESSDSVSGQGRPWSDCAEAQSDLGIHCPHMPKDIFSHGVAHIRINYFDTFFFLFFFFYLGFTALSRIFHLYRADRSSKVGENRRTRRKTTWPSVSRTWLSHIWPERGSNHSGEKPNGLRVNSLIH